VLLGPSHRVYVSGLALPEASTFETPLGPVAIDDEAAAHLPGVCRHAGAHAREHSLEVQLPFLQRILPHFRVVPLAVGDTRPEVVARVLEALWGGPETRILVSSDLSHYLPYEKGRKVDEGTARQIVELSPIPLAHEKACGATPVSGLLLGARAHRLRAELLDLRSSGDTAGDRARVVGYGAFAFFEGDEGARG
jgi:AmmeMemoRadiSam system protein B